MIPLLCAVGGYLLRAHRRPAAVTVTAGLVYCSAALVGITNGTIESHFHFFIIIGFIALYQDWAPFLFNIVFTVISHGFGSAWQRSLFFEHAAGQEEPWLWSIIHGVAVLAACAGMTVFWRVTEDQQNQKEVLAAKLAEAEVGRKQFTADLLVNLARRNQSLLSRQLSIINQLEESERNPRRARRALRPRPSHHPRPAQRREPARALRGTATRVWGQPVPFRDVLRARSRRPRT